MVATDMQKQQEYEASTKELVRAKVEEYKPVNDGHMVLKVAEPVLRKAMTGDYHEYPITGCDSNGDIETSRRFSLFYELRQALVLKYAGLYVPPLPAKKLTGKTEAFTLVER